MASVLGKNAIQTDLHSLVMKYSPSTALMVSGMYSSLGASSALTISQDMTPFVLDAGQRR